MKTEAYLCDCCECVFLSHDIVGLEVKTADLFNTKVEYNSNGHAHNCTIHFCTGCVRRHVTDLVKGIDRSKDEADYTYHYHIYLKRFYELVHTKTLLRRNNKVTGRH